MTTRRTMLAAGLSAAAAATSVTSANPQTAQKTFVLVHGAWHGGWCWRRVADSLQRQGHKVFTPTLTGLGERSHLMSRDIRRPASAAARRLDRLSRRLHAGRWHPRSR